MDALLFPFNLQTVNVFLLEDLQHPRFLKGYSRVHLWTKLGEIRSSGSSEALRFGQFTLKSGRSGEGENEGARGRAEKMPPMFEEFSLVQFAKGC